MPEIPATLIKGDRVASNTDYRDALPTNMYAVPKKVLGADGYMLVYPGLTQFADGIGIDRGANYNERFSDHYRVSGEKLVRFDETGAIDVLGDVPGTDQATLKDFYSFNTQGIIADNRMFLFSQDSGFVEVTDPDLGDPIDGVWVNGYYFLTDGEYIYHTDISDETSIDPLKFATAEFMPDPSLGVSKTQDNKVMVWGRYTLEYFVDTSSENFAFTRVETRAQKIGIVATHAKCEAGGAWYITGGRKEESLGVYAVGVGSSTKVSTREIDEILAQYTEPELADMRMESRGEKDIGFIIIRLPNETLYFNASVAKKFGLEPAWGILKSDVLGDTKYRGVNGVFDPRIGRWLYGDNQDSRVGYLDNTVCTQYDEIAEWILYTPFFMLENMSVDEIEIETIPGYTTEENPIVFCSATVDGASYSREFLTEYGGSKDYNKRFFKRRLGYVRNWMGFKFRGATESRMAFASIKVTYG